MEREIKFRGLQKNDKTFIYGDLAKMWNSIPFIMPKCFFATKDLGYDEEDPEEVQKMLNSNELALGGFIEVIPETVGQFTGLHDKNGKDIYEGDIIKSTTDFYNVKKERTTIIEWNNDIENDSFGCPITAGYSILGYDWEIIGNIHENPELST